MTEDTREGDSEAQRGAERLASETALPFNVHNQHYRFVDELKLTAADHQTLTRLGLIMVPILHDDDEVACWLEAAKAEQAQVFAVKYVVTGVPGWDHPDASLWDIEVTNWNGKWGVYNRTRCLGADGEWSWSMPAEGREEWLATHRFDLDTALRLAREQAPRVTVNGLVAEQARALWDVSE